MCVYNMHMYVHMYIYIYMCVYIYIYTYMPYTVYIHTIYVYVYMMVFNPWVPDTEHGLVFSMRLRQHPSYIGGTSSCEHYLEPRQEEPTQTSKDD